MANGCGSNRTYAGMNSEAVCRRSTNDNGYRFFHENHRSVLYHPLGLPLVAAFHGIELSNLPLSYPVKAFPPEILTNGKGNTILSKVVLAFSDHFIVKSEAWIAQNDLKTGGRLDLAFFSQVKRGQNCRHATVRDGSGTLEW